MVLPFKLPHLLWQLAFTMFLKSFVDESLGNVRFYNFCAKYRLDLYTRPQALLKAHIETH